MDASCARGQELRQSEARQARRRPDWQSRMISVSTVPAVMSRASSPSVPTSSAGCATGSLYQSVCADIAEPLVDDGGLRLNGRAADAAPIASSDLPLCARRSRCRPLGPCAFRLASIPAGAGTPSAKLARRAQPPSSPRREASTGSRVAATVPVRLGVLSATWRRSRGRSGAWLRRGRSTRRARAIT